MKIVLTSLNAKYIHINLALRWLYVANKKRYDVDLKEYTINDNLIAIAEELTKQEADVIAFSVYIWNITQTLEIIQYIKKYSDKHIIVGGPEVSYESHYLLDEGVDAISIGEGEIAFWKYIDMLDQKQAYEIMGMYTKAHPCKCFPSVDLHDLEKLENPYFLSFDKAAQANRYFYFETSRGCPYHCAYCLSGCEGSVRMFSEAYVFHILDKIAMSKIRIVKLLDRTFNVMPERALRIARYMNTHCKHQIFQFEIVAETLSEELLQFFCEEADNKRFRFEIGVQSFHKPTLDAVSRIQNNERLVEVITRLQKAKLVMHVDLIAGLPYEGMALFQHSFNRLYALHTHEIQLGILKLLKGTALKAKGEQYDYVYNSLPPYEIQATKWLNKQELEAIHACAHAVEKYYNSGRLRNSIDTILSLGLYSDAFSLFMELGMMLKQLKHPYQPHSLFENLLSLFADKQLLVSILNMDYFKIFKQRPKLFGLIPTREKAKMIRTLAQKEGIMNTEESYNYSYISYGYLNQVCGYQIVLYSNKQTYPRRYFSDGKSIQEVS
ncbi:MAG: DUF4080 domain-containing protein [Breznakia sp.]